MSKKYTELRIIFMGTPEFAVASLDALVQAGCSVIAVVTAPDKPAGRGMKLQSSAVKKFAQENNIPVLQPDKLKHPDFLQELRSLKADLQVVVAFRMLPEIVWNMPPMGTINVHGSLLPQYRGAAPINWAIINGEKETGITTFKLQHEIDTGDILLQESLPIGDEETAGELHDRMKELGASVLVKTIEGIAEASIQSISQDSVAKEETRHAPKIFTETCRINWNMNLDQVHNLVRGLSPFPGAFTILHDKMFKIYRSSKEPAHHDLEPGQYLTDKKTWLKFAAPGGFLHVIEIQLEGKKKMLVEDFLRGYHFES
ncbi:MAG: methionyl-tRNA formyltransferase [Flavisolibacter sp.]